MPSPIHVHELRTLNDLCAIQQEWSALWDRCSYATPFLAPEWLLPWTRHLFGGGEIRSLAAWSGDRLIGLAPLFIHGTESRQVSFLGSGVTDYLDFLIDDDYPDAAASIWEYLKTSAGWDFCELAEVPKESVLFSTPAITGRAFSHGRGPASDGGGKWLALGERCSVCPVVTLPSSIELLEASLSSKFRHNLRNALNRVRDLGVEFESAAPDQDGEYVEALFRLHAARWSGRGEPGVLASRDIQDFFREIALGFRMRGWLRMLGLRSRGTLHALACIFCAHDRWLYYLAGFDETLARFGPGNLLVHFAMGRAIRERAREFDFLRNSEPYKYKWRTEDRLNWRLILRPETSAGIR